MPRRIPGTTLRQAMTTRSALVSATLAEINAGKTMVSVRPGYQIQLTGLKAFVTGAFTTLTDIRLSSDETVQTDYWTIVTAQLGDAVKHSETTGTNTLAAAFWSPLAANASLVLRKTGSDAAGGTKIDFIIDYLIIKAPMFAA